MIKVEYTSRLSWIMLDMDLNSFIELKKENDLSNNFDNGLDFKEDPNEENKESQFL